MHAPGPSVFWICGAPGAGKSVAGWELFRILANDGIRTAYIDIDQVGMLYPALADDPERHQSKVEALVALMPGYAASGAQVLVVSGVIGPGIRSVAARSGLDLTLALLSPLPGSLQERVLARGGDADEANEAVAEDAALRGEAFVDFKVQTARLSVAETASVLRPHVRASGSPAQELVAARSSAAGARVVMVTGPRAVGSSTVGFGLAMSRWRAGLRTGFVDLQQLTFVAGGVTPHLDLSSLSIVQLAATHQFFTTCGAELLVVTAQLGVGDSTLVRRALPSARVTVVRLRADMSTLRNHVRARVAGSDARLAGDDLLGAGSEHQTAVVAAASAHQVALDACAGRRCG